MFMYHVSFSLSSIQGNIGQVDISSVLPNIEHLVPAVEEEPVPPVDVTIETPSSQSASSLQSPGALNDQLETPFQAVNPDSASNEQSQSDRTETVSDNHDLKSDQSETMSQSVDTEVVQSEGLLQTPKVTFITGSDTEEEGEPDSTPGSIPGSTPVITSDSTTPDINTPDPNTPDANIPDIDAIDLSNLNIEPADSFNVNIDTDLSALAADVLTGHTNTQEGSEDI